MFTTWLVLDADSARRGRFIEQNPDNLGICEDMKIGVVSILQEGVDVAVSGILTFTVGRHVTLPVLRPVSEFGENGCYWDLQRSLRRLQNPEGLRSFGIPFLELEYRMVSMFCLEINHGCQ